MNTDKMKLYHDHAMHTILAAVLEKELTPTEHYRGTKVSVLAKMWGVPQDYLYELVYMLTGKTVKELTGEPKSTAEAETAVLGQ